MKLPSAYLLPGIGEIIPRSSNPKSFYKLVLQAIAETHNVTVEYIKEDTQTWDRVYLRQMFWHFMKRTYGIKATLVWLGNLLDKDHTTVMHGIKEFQNGLDVNNSIPVEVVAKHRKFKDDYFNTKQKIEQWIQI